MTQIISATISGPGTFYSPAFAPLDPKLRFWPLNHNIEAVFTYGSGGTSVDAYIQVTHDTNSWKDVGHFGQFTTNNTRDVWRASSSDSVLDADVQNPAPHLSWWRTRYVVVGNYVGTTLQINVIGADLVRAGPF